MGNRSSKKKGPKRGIKTDTTPGANRNSHTPELRDASAPRQPFQSEASASQFESIPHRETPAALSSTNTNFRASEKQTTPVRKKYSDPLTIDDKKQILIDGLKEKYKLYYDSVKPLPYIQDRLYCVNTIFVESGVVALSGSATSYGKDASWEQLDSYKNIFNDPHRRSNRRIIEGEPGYGKSTLTLQLAYDWCNGVQDSPLADVEILILLRLRQLGNVPSIYRAIKRYLVPKEQRVKERDIKEILESCKSVAFQLDGYDEYPGRDTNETSVYGLKTDNSEENDVERIIRYKMFQESDVTLTTRYLPIEYDRAKTKRFKLTGFDETARDQYICKAVCGDDEVAIAKVKKGLKENVILDDLCQIPLLFTMFSHMTHEIKGFQKFKSVTDFLRHAMNCFHSHTRNKSKDFNAKEYSKFLEHNHSELDNIAFEGLSKANQQIAWSQVEFLQRLGQDFYDQYILVGILVEEEMYDIADGQTPGKSDKMKIEVRFYHKLFCEWFASFRVVDILCKVEDSADLEPILGKMDPFDLQYVFRFACGLNSTAGKKIIEYLKSKKDGDKFAILCILEQSGNVEGIVDTVKELCSERITISEEHSKLLQRSTIQLLQIASSHEPPRYLILEHWNRYQTEVGFYLHEAVVTILLIELITKTKKSYSAPWKDHIYSQYLSPVTATQYLDKRSQLLSTLVLSHIKYLGTCHNYSVPWHVSQLLSTLTLSELLSTSVLPKLLSTLTLSQLIINVVLLKLLSTLVLSQLLNNLVLSQLLSTPDMVSATQYPVTVTATQCPDTGKATQDLSTSKATQYFGTATAYRYRGTTTATQYVGTVTYQVPWHMSQLLSTHSTITATHCPDTVRATQYLSTSKAIQYFDTVTANH
ncbi:hypothetical protein BSL78_08754 [Apostichopus japonicus]|uniref:NACHT domain-containing protein n=1 Tax=Stichopus japonicus TaxID=307972 RepID=A0A2G8L260_STIJA|nr:hypothetical protein BSL78_08754 [Apostichopus japonicus]